VEADRAHRTLGRASATDIMMGAAGAGVALGQLLVTKKPEKASQSQTIAGSLTARPVLGGIGISGRF
jgi:hypothetical protein